MLCYDPKLKQRSRKLRNNSTLAAVLVWNQLKQNAGLPVLKTKTYHKHIVGFYCPRLKLVIEIDGESHRERFRSDQIRQTDLENLGLSVRFHDRDVKRDMANVLGCIQNWIEQHVKENDQRHPPAPPSKGE